MTNETARGNVLGVLQDWPISKIRFDVGAVRITPDLFWRVARAILDGKLGVKHDPELGASGYYDWRADLLWFKRDSYPDAATQALVVHEACHAGLDISGCSRMRTSSSEAAAYVAQCVFARAKTADPLHYRLYSDNARKDGVYEIAWEFAGSILAGFVPEESAIEALRQAVRRHPYYRRAGEAVVGYDGVPGA